MAASTVSASACDPLLSWTRRGDRLSATASGAWTAVNSEQLERLTDRLGHERAASVTLDVDRVEALDTFGAWLIARAVRQSGDDAERSVRLVAVPDRYRDLLAELQRANRRRPGPAAGGVVAAWGRALAGSASAMRDDALAIIAMLGALSLALFGRLASPPHPGRLRDAVHHFERASWRAFPIIALITFVVGAIIAQQGFFYFRKIGAEDYVVNLVGVLTLRELAALVVAIMAAGRSGSAFTAELGAMKMREEADALRTMGLDPVEVLALPRVVALVAGLPILTLLGAAAAIAGGAFVAWVDGGMSFVAFLSRLQNAVTLADFEVGLIKAPCMALVIGVVACAEGFRVKGSAVSLGVQTTSSVVKSIFLVIVLDGLFAIFFSSIGM